LNSLGTAQSPSRETTNGHGVSLSQPLRVACSCHAGSSPGLLATQQSDRRARHHHHIPHPRRVTSRASKRVDEERRSTRSLSAAAGPTSAERRGSTRALSQQQRATTSAAVSDHALISKRCALPGIYPLGASSFFLHTQTPPCSLLAPGKRLALRIRFSH